MVAPKPAEEAEPLQAGSQKSKQKPEAGAILSSLKAEANGDVGELLLLSRPVGAKCIAVCDKVFLSHRRPDISCC